MLVLLSEHIKTRESNIIYSINISVIKKIPKQLGGSGCQKNLLFSCTQVIVACPCSWYPGWHWKLMVSPGSLLSPYLEPFWGTPGSLHVDATEAKGNTYIYYWSKKITLSIAVKINYCRTCSNVHPTQVKKISNGSSQDTGSRDGWIILVFIHGPFPKTQC